MDAAAAKRGKKEEDAPATPDKSTAMSGMGSGAAGRGGAWNGNGRHTPCVTFLMFIVLLLCVWSYLDVMREDSAIASPEEHLFIRVTTASMREEENKEDFDAYVNVTALVGNAIPEPNRTTSALPRTSSREYNTMTNGERYLLYSPSGGFTNQLHCFLSAVYLAQISNRTLIVPPKGRHSNMFWGYYALEQAEVVPFDHALDFAYMEERIGVRLLPLNITLKKFHVKYLNNSHSSNALLHFEQVKVAGGLRHASHSYCDKYAQRVKASTKPVVWAHGRFYNKYLGILGKGQKHVRFSPYLREFAKTIATEALGGKYNAFHIRLGDYSKKAKAVSNDARRFAKSAKSLGFKRETPVYLATDSTSTVYFKPILKHWYKVVRIKDLNKNEVIANWLKDFYTRLPSTSIRSSLFGLVDQLLCVRAEKFVGTLVSTFSKQIVAQRHNLETVAPDMLEAPDFDKSERKDTLEWWGYGKKQT